MADNLTWFVVFNGTADRWLWSFEADGWRLVHPNPGYSALAIEPLTDNGSPASIEDARWLADALAFDHDAPVGIKPAWAGIYPNQHPRDPAATPAVLPVGAQADSFSTDGYWQALNTAYSAAAELRMTYAYVLRYDQEDTAPSTDFTARFAGHEELVVLYAMAARQADVLTEYLCLYRILEAADGQNGKTFSATHLADVATKDYGELRVIVRLFDDEELNAFEVYRNRAENELNRLRLEGIVDVPTHLYAIRNSLAHGKHGVLTPSDPARFESAARALPVVKLLARLAVEP